MITLGAAPEELHVILNDGYAFAVNLVRYTKRKTPEAWTTPPVLTFSDGTAWTATIDGNVASFSANITQVAAALAREDKSVTLTVGPMPWAKGSVRRG